MKNFSQILGIIFYGSLILIPQHLLSQTSDRRHGGAPPLWEANGGASNGGGGNAGPGNKFLDRFESENTTKANFVELLKSRPRLVEQFRLLEESAVGITEIMMQSPATQKRWLFIKHKSMTLQDPACINASIYYSQKRIVGCQNAEFVHVDDSWFSRKPVKGSKTETAEEIELDRVWFLNHELLVGFMLNRFDFVKDPSVKMIVETKLRALNASMMSVDKSKQLDKWDEDSKADLGAIVSAEVQNRTKYEEIKASVFVGFEGYCRAYSNFRSTQAQVNNDIQQSKLYSAESQRLTEEISKSDLPELEKAVKHMDLLKARRPEERRLFYIAYEAEEKLKSKIIELRAAILSIPSKVPGGRFSPVTRSGTRIALAIELGGEAFKIVSHADRFERTHEWSENIYRYANRIIEEGKLPDELIFPYTILKGSQFGCR